MRVTPLKRMIALAFGLVALWLRPSGALAGEQDRVRCAESYERAQMLRRSEDFAGANAALAVCREACPSDLAKDCVRWTNELRLLLPTIVLAVSDERGNPVADVRVRERGTVLSKDESGHFVSEPGKHTLILEHAGHRPIEVEVDLHPGERGHVVTVTMRDDAPPATPPALRPENEARSASERPSRAPSFALGAVGIASGIAAAVLGVKGQIDRQELRDTCYPGCDPADVDAVRTLFWASGITGAVAVVSLGAALVLYPWSTSASGKAAALRVGASGVAMTFTLE